MDLRVGPTLNSHRQSRCHSYRGPRSMSTNETPPKCLLTPCLLA
jgi:hypothetical protein